MELIIIPFLKTAVQQNTPLLIEHTFHQLQPSQGELFMLRIMRRLWTVPIAVGAVVVMSSQAIAVGSCMRLYLGISQDPLLDSLMCGGMSMMTYLGLYG